MTLEQNEKFLTEFKRFFLELLHWHWGLDNDNPIHTMFKNHTKMTIAEYSRYIAKRKMDMDTMQACVDISRNCFNLYIKANVNLSHSIFEHGIEFELYLTEDTTI